MAHPTSEKEQAREKGTGRSGRGEGDRGKGREASDGSQGLHLLPGKKKEEKKARREEKPASSAEFPTQVK